MARDEQGDDEQTETPHGPSECMPCRGSGKVISNLGGSASSIECPWCGGDGVRRPGVDAQARWAAEQAADGAAGDTAAVDAAA